MDSSNSAHSFQPHHTIHIEYPCRDLYDQMLTPNEQASCTPVVWVPNNSQNRHNPSEPLVYDPAVAAHADGRDSQEETGFYSRTIANLVTPSRPEGVKVMRDLFDAKETSLNAMFRHVDAMSSRLGETKLRVLLVDTLTPPVKTLILIIRTTRVISTTYDVYLNTSFYRGEFNALYNSEYQAQWFDNLSDLLYNFSDRAVCHTQRRLASWDPPASLPNCAWLPPRIPQCNAQITQATHTPATVVGQCPICQEENTSTAVEMPCGHQICLPELLQWCAQDGQGPNATCPLDREPILSEPVKCTLKYGIVNKGYVFDNRFSFSENMLRSIADLDHDLAEESDEPMWVDSEILMAAFTQILAVVALEPSTSTPFHLQPSRMMLERTVFEKHLRQRLERLHGGLLITKNLHADLVSYCNDGLAYHMLLGAHQPHEVQHDTIRDTSTVSEAVIESARIRQNMVPPPPGWKEFVVRCFKCLGCESVSHVRAKEGTSTARSFGSAKDD
ncbi:hypothetical protein LTR56_002507 [Elasticomyces elasticus]|nr:hypothetical protein LTR56_002507 [Elasticomyces elasticus]KAK4933559.1 hypothetical protein LTR49_000021 [Elasticomyces elasticus]